MSISLSDRVILGDSETNLGELLLRCAGKYHFMMPPVLYRRISGDNVYINIKRVRARFTKRWPDYDFSFFRVIGSSTKNARDVAGVVRCVKHNILFDASYRNLDRKDPQCPHCKISWRASKERKIKLRRRKERKARKQRLIRDDPVTYYKTQQAKGFARRAKERKLKAKAKIGYWHKETCVYYLCIERPNQPTVYKVGITCADIETRYSHEYRRTPGIKITEVWSVFYSDRAQAVAVEHELLKEYSPHKYHGPPVLYYTGNTEIFTHNVMPWVAIENNPILGVTV